jgi:hypothetical protein
MLLTDIADQAGSAMQSSKSNTGRCDREACVVVLKFELTCSTEKQSINLNTNSIEQKNFTVTQYHVETNWTPGRGPELRAPASRPVRAGKTSALNKKVVSFLSVVT